MVQNEDEMSVKRALDIDHKSQTRAVSASRKSARDSKVAVAGNKAQPDWLTQEIREELIVQNRSKARKLARSILRKWHSRLDLEEVDSIVDLSLCEAAQRFNPDMGAGFMTFLFYHLRGNLIRCVTAAATANTLPFGEMGSLASMDNARPTALQNAVEVSQALCSNEYTAPDEAVCKKEMVNLSQQARTHLDYLEREVIERIYMNEEQLLDIAADLGYSRCHISRIKRKALEALYDGIASLAGPDALGEKPNFDEEESASRTASHQIRRKLTTRRPRSQRAQKVQMRSLEG